VPMHVSLHAAMSLVIIVRLADLVARCRLSPPTETSRKDSCLQMFTRTVNEIGTS